MPEAMESNQLLDVTASSPSPVRRITTLRFKIGSDGLHVALRGEFDAAAVREVREAIGLGLDAGLHVVVDCSGVSFIDSAGMRVLLEAQRRGVSVVQASSYVMRTARMLRLDHAFVA
jgi:anti-anti-sigma factor